MSNHIILPRYTAKKKIGKNTAYYTLYEATAPFGRTFIFYVKYRGHISGCILDCKSKNEARRQFLMLVRNYTTPLSLQDTVYELSK